MTEDSQQKPNWPSDKQRAAQAKGLMDPLVQYAKRPERCCLECGAPFNQNHHEECWTGYLENMVAAIEKFE